MLYAATSSTQHIIIIGVIETLIGAAVLLFVKRIVGGARKDIESWLKNIMHEVKPNGGTTGSNGDTTKRTEEKVDKLTISVAKNRDNTNRRLRSLEKQAGIAK